MNCPKCGDPKYDGPSCRVCGHGMPVGTPVAERVVPPVKMPEPSCPGIAPKAEPADGTEETGWTILNGVENFHS